MTPCMSGRLALTKLNHIVNMLRAASVMLTQAVVEDGDLRGPRRAHVGVWHCDHCDAGYPEVR